MGNIDKIQLPNGNTYDINDTYKSGIYTVFGTQTEATASWTGELHGVSALFDGLTINYYLPYAGISSTSVTLNLTLDSGSTTGAKNCYINTSRLTTHYGAGRTIVMTYYSAGSISISGTATEDDRWICDAYYDTNSDTKVRQSLLTNSTHRPLLMSYAQNNNTTSNVDNVVYRNNSIYATPSTGTITALKFSGDLVGNADTATNASAVNGHTVGIDVPSNAVFTDQKVTQTQDVQAEGKFALLMEYTADGGTLTEGVRKSGATYNNATSELQSSRMKTSEAVISDATCGKINGVTVGHDPKFTDTTYESKTAASGGTDVSLCTTGEKYTWNNKSDLTIGTTSTTALAGDTLYAGASTAGGSATSAVKLDTSAGSMLNPVYFSNGVPVSSSGNSIPFIIGTGSTAGTWLGTLTGLTAYYDGLLILYKPSVAGASTTKLNLNNLGAKTCYLNNTTKLTTHYPANQPILLTYSSSQNSGCFVAVSNYDGNTKNSAGATNTTDALYLVGAKEQTTNPQTYTNVDVKVDTNSNLLSKGLIVSDASGVRLTATNTGITYNSTSSAPMAGIASDGTVFGNNTRFAVDTPTYTMTKSSGAWVANSVDAIRCGNILQMRILVKGSGTQVTNGGNGFTGSISGDYLPIIPTTLVSYISSVIIVCYIDASGNIEIRPYGGSYTASSTTTIEVDGMFICET